MFEQTKIVNLSDSDCSPFSFPVLQTSEVVTLSVLCGISLDWMNMVKLFLNSYQLESLGSEYVNALSSSDNRVGSITDYCGMLEWL